MRQDKFSKAHLILYACGIIPVVWLALLLAPYLSSGLVDLVRNGGVALEHPFHTVSYTHLAVYKSQNDSRYKRFSGHRRPILTLNILKGRNQIIRNGVIVADVYKRQNQSIFLLQYRTYTALGPLDTGRCKFLNRRNQ